MFDRVLKTSLLFISTSKYTFEPCGALNVPIKEVNKKTDYFRTFCKWC